MGSKHTCHGCTKLRRQLDRARLERDGARLRPKLTEGELAALAQLDAGELRRFLVRIYAYREVARDGDLGAWQRLLGEESFWQDVGRLLGRDPVERRTHAYLEFGYTENRA